MFLFFLTPGKHRFKSVIFQIETIKVKSIFTRSFSPFINLCEVIQFLLESLPTSETDIYPKVLFRNLFEEAKHG